jgi:hypothetical protein
MSKSEPNQSSVQLELFPSGKTEQALTWKQILINHTKPQDQILRACYGKFGKAISTGNYDELDEIHKIVASINKAGQWKKVTSEALKLADEQLNDAMLREGISQEELSKMSDEELKEAVLSWI